MSTQQTENKILLPFIIRGQEINPDELLYQSRDRKVQFHYPDPRPLLTQIILSDPTELQRNFAGVSVSEIIRFLAEAGKSMTLNHTRMEWACRFSMPFSALPASIVKGSYEMIPIVFSKNIIFDRFHALRIASVVMAFTGAILAFQPFGIYGSASAFLAIFSTGFIYAYQKFSPAQAEVS